MEGDFPFQAFPQSLSFLLQRRLLLFASFFCILLGIGHVYANIIPSSCLLKVSMQHQPIGKCNGDFKPHSPDQTLLFIVCVCVLPFINDLFWRSSQTFYKTFYYMYYFTYRKVERVLQQTFS